MGFLTSRTIAPTVTTNDLVHIVITGDTSQGNPSGSSYKATIGQIGLAIGSGSTVTISGGTDISVTGIYPNFGISFTGVTSGDYLPLSGGTVSGNTQFTTGLTANTISATTYLNLPVTTDVFVTGGTYSAGTSMFTNNTGGTFNVSGFYTGETSNVNTLTTGIGLSADTTTGNVTIINTDPDQTVVLNNGTNISVTGTYPNFTIDVTGLTDNDTYITGFTYDDNNTFTISKNSGSSLNTTINIVSGLTVNGNLSVTGNTNLNNLSATTISATTYQNLPISGLTEGNNINISGSNGNYTISVTGLTQGLSGDYLPLSGGTVTGNTIFTSGLTANTISGNTLIITDNIDTNTRVLYDSGGNLVVDWSNLELSDSLNVSLNWSSRVLSDFIGGSSIEWENRILYNSVGDSVFDWENGSLTSNTISATTYQNLPDNVTGNYLPLSGGTVSGDTTITANLTVSGNSGINWFSSNTSSDLVRITQTGNGNAFVVEDSTNPDSTPFIINTSGNTSIGSTSFFTTPGSGLGSKLSLSLGSAGYPYSGLPISTVMAIESNQTTSIGLFSPNASSSQIYFGTPSDVFGAFLRWDFTNKNLRLSTSNSDGKISFATGMGDEAASIDKNGNFGIGLSGVTLTQKLEVSGNTRIYGGITADTISATTANTETLVISNTPTTDPTNNNVLVRNTATGIIGLKDFTHYNFGLYVQTGDSATVVNTIVETTILDGGIGSLSIPANYFTPGDSFNVKIGGIVSANNNDVITIKIKSGSVILGTDTITFTNSVTNRPWDFNCDFTIRTIGAPTVASIVANGVFTYSAGSDVYGGSFNTLNNTTFDTTNPNTLDFTITWGTASAGNSIYSSMCILKKTF